MKANFNNQEHEFHIADIGLFEATVPGGSAFAMLKRFTDGTWSSRDVAHVVSYGLHGPSKEALRAWDFVKASHKLGLPANINVPYVPHPDVVRIVNEAPGSHAELAANILSEALFKEAAGDAYGNAVPHAS